MLGVNNYSLSIDIEPYPCFAGTPLEKGRGLNQLGREQLFIVHYSLLIDINPYPHCVGTPPICYAAGGENALKKGERTEPTSARTCPLFKGTSVAEGFKIIDKFTDLQIYTFNDLFCRGASIAPVADCKSASKKARDCKSRATKFLKVKVFRLPTI